MTIEYLRWFALQAAKKDFDAGYWAVYCCLAADCAVARSDVLYTTKTALAARLHLGKTRVERVLADLSSANLVRVDDSGRIEMVQPDPTWAGRVNAESQPNHSTISLNSLRARKAGAVEVTPLKGVTTSTGQNLPSGLPPKPQTQAKALNARQQLELYQRLGWIIPIELKAAAETNPDVPWERREGS